MTNWRPGSADMYEDVQTRWQYENWHTELPEKLRLRRLWRASRDSARTPMQWSGEKYAGFSSAPPWFCLNSNYPEINVASQEDDPDSLLNFYRRAVKLRKSLPVVADGGYREWYRASRQLYVYQRENSRQKLLVVCSFSQKPVRFSAPPGCRLAEGELLLKNYGSEIENNGFTARPYETRVYLFE
jgi:oligo-1,6-glucosidase